MRDRIADTLRVWEESGAYTPWEYLREPAKDPWRKKADILLDVMSGPTDAMLMAGIHAEEDAEKGTYESVTSIWEAMLRKAKG